MNAVLAVLANESFAGHPHVEVFLKSVKKYATADVILFCANLSKDRLQSYVDRGFKVVHVPALEYVSGLPLNRSISYYRWLCANPKYTNILCTDTKDVVFQADPFETDTDGKLWLFAEGIVHGVEWFNPHDHQLIEEALGIKYDLKGKHVLNASIQYGSSNILKKFLLLVHSIMLVGRRHPHEAYSDQGITNFLYHCFLSQDSDYVLNTPDVDYFCAHGVCNELTDLPPIPNYDTVFKDGVLLNPHTNKAYTMMHQWDRRLFFPQVLEYWS